MSDISRKPSKNGVHLDFWRKSRDLLPRSLFLCITWPSPKGPLLFPRGEPRVSSVSTVKMAGRDKKLEAFLQSLFHYGVLCGREAEAKSTPRLYPNVEVQTMGLMSSRAHYYAFMTQSTGNVVDQLMWECNPQWEVGWEGKQDPNQVEIISPTAVFKLPVSRTTTQATATQTDVSLLIYNFQTNFLEIRT